MLIVNFKHGDCDLEFNTSLVRGLKGTVDSIKELLAGHRDDADVLAVANDGVAFAAACLAVSK